MALKSEIHIEGVTFLLGIKLKLKEFIYSFLDLKGFEVLNISTRKIRVGAELERHPLKLTLYLCSIGLLYQDMSSVISENAEAFIYLYLSILAR